MQSITSKTEVRKVISSATAATDVLLLSDFIANDLLSKKIKFPLLEFAAEELYCLVPAEKQIVFLDEIMALKTIGGNVLAGMILQFRLPGRFSESFKKSEEYIINGNEWYVCDIIGERVQGHALLTMPEKTLPALSLLAEREDKWMVRSVGVAVHYAVKKGLRKRYVEDAFRLLLSLGNTTDFHTKKGIGWAAKTVAKFHPDIIQKHRSEIDNTDVRQWFKTKIDIGLSRTDKYAGRYTG